MLFHFTFAVDYIHDKKALCGTSVIYYVHVLCNMHGYKNNLCVMEAEALSSYSKQANNNIYTEEQEMDILRSISL